MESWDPSLNVWSNFNGSKNTITNNATGKVTSITGQIWDLSTGAYVNSSLSQMTYSASDKVLLSINKTWLGAWVNLVKATFLYDASDFLVGQINNIWNGATSAWDNQISSITSNNVAGLPLVSTTQFWSSATSTYSNSSKAIYVWGPTSVKNLSENKVKMFPNPCRNVLQIQMQEKNATTGIVYDNTGKQLLIVNSANGTLNVNTQSLPVGFYMVNILQNGSSIVKTFCKQ
jgi:hypothetical protein